MTYLATEILLYLFLATIVGLALGWLFWGLGQRRRLGALRTDLMAQIEAGREAHNKTKLSLDQAEARAKKAIDAAKTEARETIESQQLAVQQAETELERVRASVDEAIQEARLSGQGSIEEALQAASAEKAIAAEAVARESRSRAQIEELRLLIGAEKLAGESARSELERTRKEMQDELEAERAAHHQAKIALDDIRSTLARTFGSEALNMAAHRGGAPASLTDGHGRTAMPQPFANGPDLSVPTSAVMTDIEAAGEALNNPDVDEADIEDREDLSLDLPSTIDPEPDVPEDARPDPLVEGAEAGKIELRPLPQASERPPIFYKDLPNRIDNLQAIEGIDSDIERRLYENGCYHYRQITELSPSDLEWLARAIDVSVQQIESERWIEQAKAIEAGSGADQGSTVIDVLDQHLSLDLPSTIDPEPDVPEDARPDPLVEGAEAGKIELRPLPQASERPPIFYKDLPNRIDNLQAIEGIDSDIERRLYENGCYHYRQITELSPSDLEWLARAIDVSVQQIESERWIEQAKAIEAGSGADQGSTVIDVLDQQNAAG